MIKNRLSVCGKTHVLHVRIVWYSDRNKLKTTIDYFPVFYHYDIKSKVNTKNQHC